MSDRCEDCCLPRTLAQTALHIQEHEGDLPYQRFISERRITWAELISASNQRRCHQADHAAQRAPGRLVWCAQIGDDDGGHWHEAAAV